jgi:hypothetical protein
MKKTKQNKDKSSRNKVATTINNKSKRKHKKQRGEK